MTLPGQDSLYYLYHHGPGKHSVQGAEEDIERLIAMRSIYSAGGAYVYPVLVSSCDASTSLGPQCDIWGPMRLLSGVDRAPYLDIPTRRQSRY